MKKIIPFLFILILIGCKNVSEKNKTELFKNSGLKNESQIIREFSKPISELNSKTLRIWKFLGGGAIFGQVLEFKESNSTLIFHSYLLENFADKNEFFHLNFSKNIKEKEFIEEIKSIINNSNFMTSEDSRNYCEPFFSCSDTHIIEYTNGENILKFIIEDDIEECEDKRAILSKRLFKLMTQINQKIESNI
tara:strand:+ start:69 stop:644 length:576 start_codon:yes stop_codon:yes gene_type:complete